MHNWMCVWACMIVPSSHYHLLSSCFCFFHAHVCAQPQHQQEMDNSKCSASTHSILPSVCCRSTYHAPDARTLSRSASPTTGKQACTRLCSGKRHTPVAARTLLPCGKSGVAFSLSSRGTLRPSRFAVLRPCRHRTVHWRRQHRHASMPRTARLTRCVLW